VQKQWLEAFDIKIQRIEETWNTFSHQLDNRHIHLGTCYRHPFYDDAMYFFQMFYDASNIHNAFGWHNANFSRWIDLARLSHSFSEERFYLKLAEAELMHQMPVIPLHMVSYHYLARNELKGICFCHSGEVDFKWIYFEEAT
jgi:oligopeptide transport system substrate-binding protein